MTDTTATLPQASSALRAAPAPNAVLLQRTEVARGLAIFRVAPRGWSLPRFVPGQYTTLGLLASALRMPGTDPDDPPLEPSRLIRKAYSIASSSLEGEYLEFYIALVNSGVLTPRLFALGPGDALHLGTKITGMFTLDQVPQSQNIVLLATGTGVAPYMSMLRTLLGTLHDRRVVVVHGANHSWDLGYHPELGTMQRLCAWFSYVPIISVPQAEPVPWRGQTGFLHDFWNGPERDKLFGFSPSADNTHVLLCGNPLMIEAMLATLMAQGYVEQVKKTPGQIHLERFW